MRTISELRKSICTEEHTAKEVLDAMLKAIEQAWDCDKPFIEIEWYKDKFGDCHWRRKRRENMEMTQYQKDLVRMWDSTRKQGKGSTDCTGVPCGNCPLFDCACIIRGTIYNAEKAIEIVTQWAKEHPFVTNEQKYEETFGVKPIKLDTHGIAHGEYNCPKSAGFNIGTDCFGVKCEVCKEKFWKSEYKEPKREGE